MNTIVRWGLVAAMTACSLQLVIADDDIAFRGVMRKGIDNQGRVHGELAEATGWANATSLNYKIIVLNDDGTESAIDPAKTSLRFKQQFRIEIEADSDLFVYVFHEDPTGVRTILMPDAVDKNRVPQVKKSEKKILPDDGTYFEVGPPAGNEQLLVYATPERKDELTPKEAFETPKASAGNKAILELKTKQDEIINDSVKNQSAETIVEKDLKKVAEKKPSEEFRLRGTRLRPEMFKPIEGQDVAVGTSDPNVRPSLFVQIPLKSMDQQ